MLNDDLRIGIGVGDSAGKGNTDMGNVNYYYTCVQTKSKWKISIKTGWLYFSLQ